MGKKITPPQEEQEAKTTTIILNPESDQPERKLQTLEGREGLEAYDAFHRSIFDSEDFDIPEFERSVQVAEVRDYGLELGLTMEQVKLAGFLALPKSMRPTMKQLGKHFGVSRMSIYNWQHQPGFWKVVDKLHDAYYLPNIPDIVKKQRDLALQGDTSAARLILTMAGKLGAQSGTNQRVETIINNTMNVFVKDSDRRDTVNILKMAIGEEPLREPPPPPDGLNW